MKQELTTQVTGEMAKEAFNDAVEKNRLIHVMTKEITDQLDQLYKMAIWDYLEIENLEIM